MSARARPDGRPAGGLFYGWVIVVALGVTITISYGTMSYSMGVFFTPLRDEMGWSATAVSGAFSVGLLVSGGLGIVVGRLTDRHGARAVMSAGSLLGGAGLLLFSFAHGLWTFYLAWAVLIAAGGAASMYPPAFTAINAWFEAKRASALGLLTLLGGFAAVIFIPLDAHLIDALGWRVAARVLGVIVLAVALPLHALVLRRRPSDLGLQPDGRPPGASSPMPAGDARPVLVGGTASTRSPAFVLLTAAFICSSLATSTVIVHQIPRLVEQGLDATEVATAAGLIGVASLPGRVVLSSLAARISPALLLAGVTSLMGASLFVLLAASSMPLVYAYVVLFGIGFGTLQPLRAEVMARHFERAVYGSVLGVQGAILAVPTAAGPLLAGAAHDVTGGYTPVFLGLIAAYGASAVLLVVAARPSIAGRGVVLPVD